MTTTFDVTAFEQYLDSNMFADSLHDWNLHKGNEKTASAAWHNFKNNLIVAAMWSERDIDEQTAIIPRDAPVDNDGHS